MIDRVLALAVVLLGACQSEPLDCSSGQPSVIVTLDAPLCLRIADVLEVTFGSTHIRTEIGGALSDGTTSFSLPLPSLPPKTLEVSVSVIGGPGARVLGMASGSLRPSRDSCNKLDLVLRPIDGAQAYWAADAEVGDAGELDACGAADF